MKRFTFLLAFIMSSISYIYAGGDTTLIRKDYFIQIPDGGLGDSIAWLSAFIQTIVKQYRI